MNNMLTVAAKKSFIGIGLLALISMVLGVIYSVVMRYVFNITYTFLEELLTLLFTFTTFWGSGVCILNNEHITIDYFFLKIKPSIRRFVNIFNYFIVLAVNITVLYYCINWIKIAGKMVSNGLRIQYFYIYSIMPIGIGACIICIAIKIFFLFRETR